LRERERIRGVADGLKVWVGKEMEEKWGLKGMSGMERVLKSADLRELKILIVSTDSGDTDVKLSH
jgi:hypothetical protein